VVDEVTGVHGAATKLAAARVDATRARVELGELEAALPIAQQREAEADQREQHKVGLQHLRTAAGKAKTRVEAARAVDRHLAEAAAAMTRFNQASSDMYGDIRAAEQCGLLTQGAIRFLDYPRVIFQGKWLKVDWQAFGYPHKRWPFEDSSSDTVQNPAYRATYAEYAENERQLVADTAEGMARMVAEEH
jgi:alkylation response protein AidB-like acyl-CoA dehydrogenase